MKLKRREKIYNGTYKLTIFIPLLIGREEVVVINLILLPLLTDVEQRGFFFFFFFLLRLFLDKLGERAQTV